MEKERIIGKSKKAPETLADYFANRKRLSEDLDGLKREVEEPQAETRTKILIFLPSGVLNTARKKIEMTEVRESHFEVQALSAEVLNILQAANDEALQPLEGQVRETDYKPHEVHVAHLGEHVAGAYNLVDEKTFVAPEILEASNEHRLNLVHVLNHEKMHERHEKAAKKFGVAFRDENHEIIEGLNSLVDNYVNRTPIPQAYQKYVDEVQSRVHQSETSLKELVDLYLAGNVSGISLLLGYEVQKQAA